MKQALIRNNLMLVTGAFLTFLLVSITSLYFFYQQQTKTLVSFVLSETKLAYEQFDGTYVEFIDTFDSESKKRITILDGQGIVLIDSFDSRIGQDKSERPEIKEIGLVVTRTSETVGIELVYMATILNDGNIMRVAIPLASQALMYTRVLWVLIAVSTLFMGIYYLGLVKLNRNLLAPWDNVKQGLSKLSQGDYQPMALSYPYPEINEIIHEMNLINLETDKHVRSIETYQNQLNEILNELKQGVMLFDSQEKLVYFNQDAANYFNLNDDAYDKPSYHMIRHIEIQKAIIEVNHNHGIKVFDIKQEGKQLEIKAFKVDVEGRNKTKATVLVLIKDVSQERILEQMKKDFFSHASHELKSPLTAIRGFAELIEHQLINHDEYQKISHEIVNQTEHMASLVEDMLMLSRLENLKEKRYVQTNIEEILSQVIHMLNPLAESKELKVKVQSIHIEGYCDPIDIQKLFKNIVENAYKYTEPQKKVDIHLNKIEDMLVFTVKDEGIGIAEEHQQRIFERFYRVDKGRLDGGTGLGLAIVKHISLKYDGSIELKSSLSRGTMITVKLHV